MKLKLFTLLVVTVVSVTLFAKEGGSLTSNVNPINPTETVTLSYDGTGTNFADWEPQCFIHTWLVPAEGMTFTYDYGTAWVECNGDADYAALPAKVKMTKTSIGHYNITINIQEFFNVTEADLAKIAKIGVVVRAQYSGEENQTVDFLLPVAIPGVIQEIPMTTMKLVPRRGATANAKFAAWYWIDNENAGQWTDFFAGSGDTLTAQIPVYIDNIEFVRFNPAATEPAWDAANTPEENRMVWSETNNLKIESNVFTITHGFYYTTDYMFGTWAPYYDYTTATTRTVFLHTNGPLFWNQGGAKFSAEIYEYGEEGSVNAFMTKVEGELDIYKLVVPKRYNTGRFYRLSGSSTQPAGNPSDSFVWDFTDEVAVYDAEMGVDMLKITGFWNSSYNHSGVDFKKYSPSNIELEDGFYLIGQYGLVAKALDADLLFSVNPNDANEYQLDVTLEENQRIKVVKIHRGEIIMGYPAEGTYRVDAAHTGLHTVYFREELQGGEWTTFGGHMWIGANQAAATPNIETAIRTTKFFHNGQIFIIRGDRTYTLTGQEVR